MRQSLSDWKARHAIERPEAQESTLPVEVEPTLGRSLLDAVVADPSLELTIDVARGTVEAPAAGLDGTFPLDEFTRERFLNGWDDIGLTLRHGDAITTYERTRSPWMPTVTA